MLQILLLFWAEKDTIYILTVYFPKGIICNLPFNWESAEWDNNKHVVISILHHLSFFKIRDHFHTVIDSVRCSSPSRATEQHVHSRSSWVRENCIECNLLHTVAVETMRSGCLLTALEIMLLWEGQICFWLIMKLWWHKLEYGGQTQAG